MIPILSYGEYTLADLAGDYSTRPQNPKYAASAQAKVNAATPWILFLGGGGVSLKIFDKFREKRGYNDQLSNFLLEGNSH